MITEVREEHLYFIISIDNGHFFRLIKIFLSINDIEAIRSRNGKKIIKVLIDYKKQREAELRVISSYIKKYSNDM